MSGICVEFNHHRWFSTFFNKNNLILDVACGTGVVTKQIQKKIGKSGYVIGIDTSTTAIKNH